MTPPSLPIPSGSIDAPRAPLRMFAHVLSAALLIVGGALTIGALWLPWRHYVAPDPTALLSPEDMAPYIPIADGLGHSFLVFTVGALATGALAWLAAVWQRGQAARVLALACILCAGVGILFASLGIDGAQVWRANEATDGGFSVCLLGYAALIAAGGIMMATAGRTVAQS